MRSEEFNEIVQDRIQKSVSTLVKKAGEYADGEDDRLHNFRRAAALRGQSMREALGGMMLKHTVSVYDMIGNPDVDYPQEVWDEKLGDHINYLFLLDAVVRAEKTALAEAEAASDAPEPEEFGTWREFSDAYPEVEVRNAGRSERAEFIVRGYPYKRIDK